MTQRNDIVDRKDIEMLVDRFYETVREDPLLAPQFAHVEWARHLPTMYNFWSSMMLGEQSYRGNPFQKHVGLPLERQHFNTWIKIFMDIVDGNFRGEKAEEIKKRAQQIAGVFQHRMNLMKETS
ncbi:hemoglobin [Chryseolinea serpens]|uniref:Hemoglobin n=1 Tax=Chryseolinea serpens TaxID=947013 RepID=A0A1M5QRQ0_9BACT|nr:group III truncated hemoglobin [Chryseolinea serpens]SHH16815.1 hemoglobin [Chryseolinea serpens]